MPDVTGILFWSFLSRLNVLNLMLSLNLLLRDSDESSISVDEASIDSRMGGLKKKSEKLGKTLEKKKVINDKDAFVPVFNKFHKDACKQLKLVESMIDKYKKELDTMRLQFFEVSSHLMYCPFSLNVLELHLWF